MSRPKIVLDADILIRGVLGVRVRQLLLLHAAKVALFAPAAAVEEARRYLPALLTRRGVPLSAAMLKLDALLNLLDVIDADVYEPWRAMAVARIGSRDPPRP